MQSHPEIANERIGGYRVLRRLATGGTSDVLLARAEGPHGFGRMVVLKKLLAQYQSDPQFERMFAREAGAYARLSHPCIVSLYDFFSFNGQLVMVIEFVDGLPLNRLRAMLRGVGHSLDDRAAIYVVSRIFAALAAAHSARDAETSEFAPVIHRDVNPSNVLIPWDGHVKLADFGIAKVAGMSSETQHGLIKGTYGYMAPEQVRGESLTVRADVYAGALMLWELLARRKAIQRGALPEMEVLRAMAEPQIVSLDILRPDVDPSVRDAVRRGIEPVADKRAITAEEMVSVLKAAVKSDQGRDALMRAMAMVRPVPASDVLVPTESNPGADAEAAHIAESTRPDAKVPLFPIGDSDVEELARAVVALSPMDGPSAQRSLAPRPARAETPLGGIQAAPGINRSPMNPPSRQSTVPPTLSSDMPPRPGSTLKMAATPSLPPSTLRFNEATSSAIGLPSAASAPPGVAAPSSVGADPFPAWPLARSGPPPSDPNSPAGIPNAVMRAPPTFAMALADGTSHAPLAHDAPGWLRTAAVGFPPVDQEPAEPPESIATTIFVPGANARSSVHPSMPPAAQSQDSAPQMQVQPPWASQTPAAPVNRVRFVLISAIVLVGSIVAAAGALQWRRTRSTIPQATSAKVTDPSAAKKPDAPAPTSSATAIASVVAVATAPGIATAASATTATATATAAASAGAVVPAAAPTPTVTATAPIATAAPTPTPTPTPSAAAASGEGEGNVKTDGSSSGHRIFIDGHVAGQTPDTIHVHCGKHTIRLGSSGKEQAIDVPCGGEVAVK